jgi:hypothetical protein
MAQAGSDLASLIERTGAGDAAAREQLFAQAYAQLERMARKRLNQGFGRAATRCRRT